MSEDVKQAWALPPDFICPNCGARALSTEEEQLVRGEIERLREQHFEGRAVQIPLLVGAGAIAFVQVRVVDGQLADIEHVEIPCRVSVEVSA